jgi:hypothetical protein
MIVAVLTLAAMLVGLAAALILERRRHDTDLTKREEAWAAERAELLNRIQRPEWMPPRTTPRTVQKPPDHAAYAQIGSLTATARENGDGDDA